MKLLNTIAAAALFASTALCTPVSAQSTGPFSTGPSSGPFSFPDASSSSSSAVGFGLLPTSVALGFGLGLSDMELRDELSREVLSGNASRYWDLLIYWRMAQTAAVLSYVQLGYFYHRADVDKVTQPGGTVFNTTGHMTQRGLFLGFALAYYLDNILRGGGEVRQDIVGMSSRPRATANAGLSIGYGWQDFSAFSGSFAQDEQSLFLRAEIGADIPISTGSNSYAILNPGLVYTVFDGDSITGDNLAAVLRVKFEF